MALSDRIIIMNKGVVAQMGTLRRFITTPTAKVRGGLHR